VRIVAVNVVGKKTDSGVFVGAGRKNQNQTVDTLTMVNAQLVA
jgi:hypothetical protein